MIEPTDPPPIQPPPGDPLPARPSHGEQGLALFVAGLVIIVDFLTKSFIEGWLPLNTSWAPWPEYAHLFQFTHVANTGAAFGLFPRGSLLFTFAAVIVSAIIIIYNFGLAPGQRLLRLALGLQLGGALGNLIDRLRLGWVTDFFDFGPWAIFNIADAAIVAGVVVLGWLMWLESRETAAAVEAPALAPDNHEERSPLA